MIVRIKYRVQRENSGNFVRKTAAFRINSDDPEQVDRIVSNALYFALKSAADSEESGPVQVEQL